MKKKVNIFIMLLAFLLFVSIPSKAYAKLKAPSTVTTDAKVGIKYYKKHPVNYTPGTDTLIKWSKVKKADGYRVKIYWLEMGNPYTTNIYVKKSGSKYKFSCKKKNILPKMRKYTGDDVHSFTSKKLQFIAICGSDELPVKVRVNAYQIKNEKKVYGKPKTVKVKNPYQ